MSYLEFDLHTELPKVTLLSSGRRRNPPNPTVDDIEDEFSSRKCCYRILLLSLVFLFYSSIFYLGVMGQINFGNLLPLSRLAQTKSTAYKEVREEEWARAFEKRYGTGGGGQIPDDHPELISMIRTLYLYPPLLLQSRSQFQHHHYHHHERHNSTNPISRFVRHVFRNKTNGFFLEYPASNGLSESGNADLEHNLRWNGLLIEPLPALALQALRSRLSRHVWISDACLSTIRLLHKSLFASTSTATLRAFHPGLNGSAGSSRSTNMVTVQCVPLYSLLLAVNMTLSLDYFYLDNRATEYKILKVIPYDLVRIGVIIIRNWQPTPGGQLVWFLETRGYVRVALPGRFSEFLVFVHASLEGSLPDT